MFSIRYTYGYRYTRRWYTRVRESTYEFILVRLNLRRVFDVARVSYHTIISPLRPVRVSDRIEAGCESKSRDLEPAAGCEAGARGSTNVFILYGCRSALESVSF